MADGFVKEPAVATRANFDPSSVTPEQLEHIKLEDGILYHEHVKGRAGYIRTRERQNESSSFYARCRSGYDARESTS